MKFIIKPDGGGCVVQLSLVETGGGVALVAEEGTDRETFLLMIDKDGIHRYTQADIYDLPVNEYGCVKFASDLQAVD